MKIKFDASGYNLNIDFVFDDEELSEMQKIIILPKLYEYCRVCAKPLIGIKMTSRHMAVIKKEITDSMNNLYNQLLRLTEAELIARILGKSQE
jgi:hypothetical protein